MGEVARQHALAGEIETAVTWLGAEGALDELGELLAREHWTQVETLGVAPLRAVIELLGVDRLRRQPAVLLTGAWIAESRDPGQRRDWIAQGLELTAGQGRLGAPYASKGLGIS